MRAILYPVVTALSIGCLAAPLAVITTDSALAQAKQQPAPKQAPAKEAAPAPAPPEAKQIALTDKQIESVLASQKDFDALGSQQPADKPGAKASPNMLAKLDDVAKKYGFANYAEYAVVQANIELVMGGFDPKTKTYVGPEAVLKQQLAEIQADKKMSAADKKDALADINEALKSPPPALEYKANIDLVAKYYDKLSALMQDDE